MFSFIKNLFSQKCVYCHQGTKGDHYLVGKDIFHKSCWKLYAVGNLLKTTDNYYGTSVSEDYGTTKK